TPFSPISNRCPDPAASIFTSKQTIVPSVHHECYCQTHPLYQLLSVLHLSLLISLLASAQCPPTALGQSLHWPPLSVLHRSLPIPSLANTQCPPPLSANLSTDHHSVSSTPRY
ncbi:unnamed protein product, partial [Staurois parvus]